MIPVPSGVRVWLATGVTAGCSAIHCRFVYVFVELSVSSSVSRQWL